ncbi:MAG: type II secretion system protein [Fusobacteriaceae bacterium]
MRNKEKGFTLIELVVVVAIISILAALITPKVRLSLLKAKDVKIEVTLETLRTASNLYFAEKNRILGSENLATGSGVAKGTVTGYIPYGMTKASYPLTLAHLKLLVNKKYLDKGALRMYVGKIDATTIKGVPGVNILGTNCDNMELKDNAVLSTKEVTYIFDEDEIGISLWDGLELNPKEGEGRVDSSCQVWNIK